MRTHQYIKNHRDLSNRLARYSEFDHFINIVYFIELCDPYHEQTKEKDAQSNNIHILDSFKKRYSISCIPLSHFLF